MDLFLVRHAKSAHDYRRWKSDGERPLADKGINRQTKASRGMKEFGIEFDTVWVSPFVRAQQTLDIIQSAYGIKLQPRIVNELKVWGDPERVMELLMEYAEDDPDAKLLVVGHNPNISNLVELLTGESIYMSTSDLVHIVVSDSPELVKYYARNELMV